MDLIPVTRIPRTSDGPWLVNQDLNALLRLFQGRTGKLPDQVFKFVRKKFGPLYFVKVEQK